MGFFDLDKTYKLVIFRIGFISFCLTGIGILVFLGFYSWNKDWFKDNKDNQKLNNGLEKFYYIFGYIISVIIILNLIVIAFGVI
jgi:hypothetical protein